MNKLNLTKGSAVLVGVLGAQVILAGALFWQSNRQATFAAPEALVQLDAQSVDEIVLEDEEQSITLTRRDDEWVLQGSNPLPADAIKVSGSLDVLTNLKAGLPVATREASQEQLEVAEDNFQRRVVLKGGGDELAQFYVGTSPGFRKAHVRLAGSLPIYSAPVNVYDLNLKADNWLDKKLLRFETVEGVSAQGIELARTDDAWSIISPADQQDTHEVDADRMDEVMRELTHLSVLGIADSTNEDEANADREQLLLSILTQDSPVQLTLEKVEGEVIATRDDVPGSFRVSSSVFDVLSSVGTELLVPKSEGVEASAETEADAESVGEQSDNSPG